MKLPTFIFASVTLTIQYYADKYQADDFNKTLEELEPDLDLPNIRTFDFIIVGGGTAGCLLAGRLSEHFTVLLIEAGGSPVPAVSNPFLTPKVASHSAINNLFKSQKQDNFTQESRGIVFTHTGRMLGGSGSHNGNVYIRGSPYDYDNYANLTGDESWLYSNVVQHFKTLEGFHGPLVNENERHDFYSSTGSLHTETDWPPIMEGWFQSAKELGYQIGDSNGYQKEGFSPVVKSMKNGERVSTYTTFVKPFESTRKKLKVLRYSQVKQILIDANKKAYGVAYSRHRIPQIAHASKEVIISCGTFQSPLLLIKSGIGPKDVLKAAHIPIIHDLPGVGQNLRDHGAVSLLFSATNLNATLLPSLEDKNIEEELIKYQDPHQRSGYFARMPLRPQALIVSSRAKLEGEELWPDILIVFAQHVNIGAEQGLGLSIVLGRGKSVGQVGFDSENFGREKEDTKLALVDFKLFTEPSDRDVLIEGIKLGLKIMENTTTFVEMGVKYTETSPPPCKHLPFRSDDYWKCYIEQRGRSYLHIVGTCKMGKADDPLAVVDSKLRVFGVTNLRVVDASILPRTPNANTNAPVMLVAEKTAKEILSQYKYS